MKLLNKPAQNLFPRNFGDDRNRSLRKRTVPFGGTKETINDVMPMGVGTSETLNIAMPMPWGRQKRQTMSCPWVWGRQKR